MEGEVNISGKCIIVTSMVIVTLWTMVSIVSAVPLYDSINISSFTIGQGQPWILNGSAPGYTDIQVWIFGPDEVLFFVQPAEPEGSYSISLLPEKTRDMTPGRYHAVLQFPDEQGVYAIMMKDGKAINTKKPASQQQIFSIIPETVTPLSPFAYASFIQALDDPAVNDTYADITFTILPLPSTEPAVKTESMVINPVGDHTVGDQFAIDGTTTLSAGEEILVQIMPSSFVPGLKIPEGKQQGSTGTVQIMGIGGGKNTWSFPVDTTRWLADEYLVSAAEVNGNANASAVFTLYSGSISIDPISNHTAGDMVTITGTSMISENDPIYIQFLFLPHILTKEITATPISCGDSGGHVTSINRTSQKYWSHTINTNGCSPGTYSVEAFSRSDQVKGDTRQFEIYPDMNATSRPTTESSSITLYTTPQTATTPPAPLPVALVILAMGIIIAITSIRKQRRD